MISLIEDRGAALSRISALVAKCSNAGKYHAIKIWTPEHTAGYVVIGASVSHAQTIDIVVHDGHAYAVLPLAVMQDLPRQFREPVPQVGEVDSKSFAVAREICRIAHPINPALKGRRCYLPSVGVTITNYRNKDMSLGNLNAKMVQNSVKVNSAIKQRYEQPTYSPTSQICKDEHNRAVMYGACVPKGASVAANSNFWIAHVPDLAPAIQHEPHKTAVQILPVFEGAG